MNFMQESRENAGRGREPFLPPKDRAVHHTAVITMELLKSIKFIPCVNKSHCTQRKTRVALRISQ